MVGGRCLGRRTPPVFSLVLATLVIAFSLISRSASADTGETVNLQISPVFSQGSLVGCQAVFDVARQDPEYRNNALVLVSGSLTAYLRGDRAGVMLKLGVAPLEEQARAHIAPSAAYLTTAQFETNASELTR